MEDRPRRDASNEHRTTTKEREDGHGAVRLAVKTGERMLDDAVHAEPLRAPRADALDLGNPVLKRSIETAKDAEVTSGPRPMQARRR